MKYLKQRLHNLSSQQLNSTQAFFLFSITLSVVYFLQFVCTVVPGYIEAPGNTISNGQPVGRDFSVFWTAARLMIEHGAATVYDPTQFTALFQQAFGPLPYPMWGYPPPYLLFIGPLGFMPYKMALLVWLIAGFAVLLTACQPPRKKIPLYLLAFILAPNISFGLFSGQNGLFMSAILIAGIRLSPKKPVWAGIIFGLMIIKPQLALMVPVYLIATRNWRAILASIVSSALLVVISILVFTIAPWNYLWHMSDYVQSHVGTLFHIGAISVYMFAIFLAGHSSSAIIAQTVCTMGVLFTSFYAYARTPNTQLHLVLFAAGMFLITPYIWFYDTPILAIAVLTLLANNFAPKNLYQMMLYGAIWFLPILQLYLPMGALIIGLFYIHVYRVSLMQRTLPESVKT